MSYPQITTTTTFNRPEGQTSGKKVTVVERRTLMGRLAERETLTYDATTYTDDSNLKSWLIEEFSGFAGITITRSRLALDICGDWCDDFADERSVTVHPLWWVMGGSAVLAILLATC